MARKRSADSGGGGGGDWLNTYADMVTLLLTFFILLFSMSSLDAAKFNIFVNAVMAEGTSADKIVITVNPKEADGATDGQNRGDTEEELGEIDLAAIAQRIQEFIEQNSAQDNVEVSSGDGYVFIRFMDEMLFQPNSARLKDPNMEILNFVGQAVKSVQTDVEMISVNGHTAAILENPDYAVSDRDLSSARANVILKYMEDNVGVDSNKLVQVAWGKYRPFAPNDTEDGRSKNRRVEILISATNPIAEQLDNVYEQLRAEQQ